MKAPLLLAGLWFLSGCATSALDGSTDRTSLARAQLTELVEGALPGIQYVVVDEQGVVFEAALGVRDVKSEQPMESGTRMMAYSMTKAITAIAAMKLVEQGKLGLDRPLSDYFAAHPYGEQVTIRSLLAQTSGVPNPMPLDWFSVEGAAFDRDQRLGELLREHPELDHEPGGEYSYSNLSYWLLEKAIEKASGLDYAEYVERSVFAPLSLSSESASFALGDAGRSATGHSRRYAPMSLFASLLAPSDYWVEPHGRWSRVARVVPHGRGYGGLYANAGALGAVLGDLLRDESTLLGSALKKQMFARQSTDEGPIDMTLGWVIGELDGERYFGKQGGGLGFHGNLRIYPDRGLATVFLANRTELSAGPIDERSNELDRIFLAKR